MGDEQAPLGAQPTSDASQTPGEQTARPDFATVLSQLDSHLAENPDLRREFRGSRIAMGIAGEMAQRQRQLDDEANAAQAIQKERDWLKTLRREDPIKYAEEMDTQDELREQSERLAAIEATTRKQFTDRLGKSLKDLPEFAEMTPDEVKAIAAKLQGVPEDEVLGVFNRAVLDAVADKRAAKREKDAADKAVAENRKVWEAEQRSKRLQSRQAPSISAPSTGSASDDGDPEPDVPSHHADWVAWDKRQRKAGAGIYNRARYSRAS